jgi:hypothetical protein
VSHTELRGRALLFVKLEGSLSSEGEAALAWLNSLPAVRARVVSIRELPEILLGYDATLWLHWTRAERLGDDEVLAIDAHVRAGGGLLATLAAVTLPNQLGWEDNPPNEQTEGVWADEPEDSLSEGFSERRRMRGLQSFRGHPLFAKLGSGAYTWQPGVGERFVRYAYTGEQWPGQGRVIAVQKSFIAMNPSRRLAWEYMVGDGWAVCIGGYVYFAAANRTYRPHLEQVVRNAIDRVAPNGQRVRDLGGAWTPPALGLEMDDRVPLPPPLGDARVELEHDLQLARAAGDQEYTLAGSRALLVGRERTGHEEIWFHPCRAVSRWTLERQLTKESQSAEPVVATRVRISPGVVERVLDVGGQTVRELTSVARDRAAILVELRPVDGAARLSWTLETDFRLMWPYPPWSTGRLSYSVQGGAVGIRSETGEWLGVRIEPAPSVLTVSNASDDERSRARCQAELALSGPTRIFLLGALGSELSVDTVSVERNSLSYNEVTYSGTLSSSAVLDRELEDALRWACYRLASYLVHVPGLGACLVGGYGRSRSGAFGDGRPGYAWFFGRDACWTALACLAVGEVETVRQTLLFLGRHQDITGKILHECTTSGVVHYDAADSTPLYLLLVARYLAATGDSSTIEREWPHVESAYAFCLSTDSDGDGLIENTGVGHGWVEFGRLGQHHVSLYLAGIWVAALSELEPAARALGKRVLADELAYRAAVARASLELSFYDPLAGRYATGRRADGSRNMAETAMTAVPLLLGAVRPERCRSWLDRVGSADFTSEWGVRMVPRSDPEYRPEGYHAGSVWPLFTGWVSLAERAAGRLDVADRHWRQVARLYTSHALGAWPEVLHGEEPRSIGVTSDQAWSTAMAVLPMP